MKPLKHYTLLLVSLLLLGIACKKEPNDELSSALVDKETSSLNLRNQEMKNKYCLPTHLEDDGFAYSLDLYYNEAGDPESILFDGYPAFYEYDSRKRLKKAVFGPAIYGENRPYYDYSYIDQTSLPASLKYFSPLNGGLLVTLDFHYNKKGQLKQIENTIAQKPMYNSVEKFEYDNKGNVIKVTKKAANGGIVYDTLFTEYEVMKYDNENNFMGGNQWLKYMFFYTQLETYEFMMFSKNNAADWLWRPEAYTFYFPDAYYLKSSFNYNSRGFANKVNIRFYDFYGSENYFEFARTSSSTCDSDKINTRQGKYLQPKVPLKNIDHIPQATIYH